MFVDKTVGSAFALTCKIVQIDMKNQRIVIKLDCDTAMKKIGI